MMRRFCFARTSSSFVFRLSENLGGFRIRGSLRLVLFLHNALPRAQLNISCGTNMSYGSVCSTSSMSSLTAGVPKPSKSRFVATPIGFL